MGKLLLHGQVSLPILASAIPTGIFTAPSTFLPYLLIFPGKICILTGEYVPQKRNIQVDAKANV